MENVHGSDIIGSTLSLAEKDARPLKSGCVHSGAIAGSEGRIPSCSFIEIPVDGVAALSTAVASIGSIVIRFIFLLENARQFSNSERQQTESMRRGQNRLMEGRGLPTDI